MRTSLRGKVASSQRFSHERLCQRAEAVAYGFVWVLLAAQTIWHLPFEPFLSCGCAPLRHNRHARV